MRKARFTLIFLAAAAAVMLVSTTSLGAEEYWSDYFHLLTKHNFDSKAKMYGKMTKEEAKNSGDYTAVRRDDNGRVLEAVTMLDGEPNYYYAYYYNDAGDIVLRKMNAYLEKGETPMSKVVYSYNEEGKPLSTAYYTFNFFGDSWKIKYLKQYLGANYRVFDYSKKEKDRTVERKLDEINKQLEELQELESRNILKKMLGIR